MYVLLFTLRYAYAGVKHLKDPIWNNYKSQLRSERSEYADIL